MHESSRCKEVYRGFEQGPIRPPSEAQSLLIRVTRNCPWNRCTFCPVYKGESFSLRPLDHVLRDIDAVYGYIERLRQYAKEYGERTPGYLQTLSPDQSPEDVGVFHAAMQWFGTGMRSVFLQDANSLIMKPGELVQALTHLRVRFPEIRRITSYARAHTVAARKRADLQALADAGLNRVHIGLESGSDAVLARVQKGVTKAKHIEAGRAIRETGMELSEYYMPGLGGRDLSREHALESADALNQIHPHFIRIRTLAIPQNTPLYEEWESGGFQKCTDRETAEELHAFIAQLDGITSTIKSDHILNLFDDLQGVLPEDKPRMLAILEAFLGMDPGRQALYQLGRRLGLFTRLADLEDPRRRAAAEQYRQQLGITPDKVDAFIDEAMRRFI